MNFATLASLTLAVGLLSTQPSTRSVPAIPVETVKLAWKLKEGASYLVETSSSVSSKTVTMDQEQEEDQDNTTVHLVHVADVTEEGNMLLKITVNRFEMAKESAMFDVELLGERDEEGKVTVDVVLTSDLPLLTGDDVQELFEELVRGSMAVEFEMLLTPQGEVIEASMEGDPLADLPGDTDLTKMISDTARIMVGADDMTAMLASQFFSMLPETSPEVGGQWSVERSFAAAGLEMNGTGTCTLEELGEKGAVAHLTETLTYELDASGLSEKMIELMDLMLGEMEMDVEADLEGEGFESVSKIEFDVKEGFSRSMTWKEMAARITGTITLGEMEMDMELDTLTSGSSKWSRVEEE